MIPLRNLLEQFRAGPLNSDVRWPKITVTTSSQPAIIPTVIGTATDTEASFSHYCQAFPVWYARSAVNFLLLALVPS